MLIDTKCLLKFQAALTKFFFFLQYFKRSGETTIFFRTNINHFYWFAMFHTSYVDRQKISNWFGEFFTPISLTSSLDWANLLIRVLISRDISVYRRWILGVIDWNVMGKGSKSFVIKAVNETTSVKDLLSM